MIQLKNAKILPKGDKIFLIDAPEMPCKDKCESTSYCFDTCCKLEAYQEALSKAPTWEIKNGEEVKYKLCPCHNCRPIECNWQPEQGKLYDLPNCEIEFELDCKNNCGFGLGVCTEHPACKKIAILKPVQQEVKEESQEDLINEVSDLAGKHAHGNDSHGGYVDYDYESFINELKSKFYLTRR